MTEQARILGERYELGPPVGTGGMATVYRAKDRVLGRDVAVKVLSDGYAADDRFVERFRREARAAAALNHPNVVTVYDHGEDGDARYIVMEHIEGRTLAEVLQEEGALAPERAAAISAAVARALEAAHQRGLVHRDVKPANILLGEDDRVKVADFGIARAAADVALTATGTVIGTASYISPEQASGAPADHRSDIYSLGCVLYEMLTGSAPFDAESQVALASRHVNDPPVPPSELRDGIPPSLETVVLRALAKDPAERFQTAAELAAAVGAEPLPGEETEVIAPVQRTAVMPATTPALPAAGRRRGWLPWALAAAGVGLLGLLLVFAQIDGSGDGSLPKVAERQDPSPSVEPTPPASFLDAYSAFIVAVEQALEGGSISPGAAKDLTSSVDDARQRYFEGKDADEVIEKLDDARNKLADRVEDGEVDPTTASAIEGAIDAMEAAIRSDPPEPIEDEGDDPGNGKGKAKGKNKDGGSGD